MKQQYVRLMIGCILIAGSTATASAGSDDDTSQKILQSSQNHLEQQGNKQNKEPLHDGQKLQDPVALQGVPDSLLERDDDRLRDLEQELAEEQVKDSDRQQVK